MAGLATKHPRYCTPPYVLAHEYDPRILVAGLEMLDRSAYVEHLPFPYSRQTFIANSRSTEVCHRKFVIPIPESLFWLVARKALAWSCSLLGRKLSCKSPFVTWNAMQGVHHMTYRWCNGSTSGALAGANMLPRKRGGVLELTRSGTASAPPRARAFRGGFFVTQIP